MIRIGAAGLVENEDGLFLFGQRGKEPNYGKWILPGGGIKFGESWIDTIKREILEETNMSVSVTASSVFPHEIIKGNEHRMILFAMCQVADDYRLKASSDLLDAKFVRKSEIQDLDLSPDILPVLKHFRLY